MDSTSTSSIDHRGDNVEKYGDWLLWKMKDDWEWALLINTITRNKKKTCHVPINSLFIKTYKFLKSYKWCKRSCRPPLPFPLSNIPSPRHSFGVYHTHNIIDEITRNSQFMLLSNFSLHSSISKVLPCVEGLNVITICPKCNKLLRCQLQ